MTVTRPRVPRNATSQRVILDALFEQPGQVVQSDDLVERLYGSVGPSTTTNLHLTMTRLRKRFPGLEVETVFGYRLRAGREAS